MLVSSVLGKGDDFKTMSEVCLENGFASENYTITTEDGYMIDLYRIPGQVSEETGSQPKPAVLLQHGIDCDMMMWIFNSPDKANAFILSRAGFDVWIGNNRGTTYGMGHQSLDPKERPFWDFYQEDMARKDLPAFIDFILETTGLETISYIGHSQGTT